MPKKKDPPEDPQKQHERFKEAAREHGADESGEKSRYCTLQTSRYKLGV